MATVKVKGIGLNQFGGVDTAGNLTTYRATLQTNATGAALNSTSTAALAIADKVVLNRLPAGMLLEDAQVIVSTAMTAAVTGSLGFEYSDGVDVAGTPQDAAYFGSGLALNAAGRIRTTSSKVPVLLPKDVNLILTIAGAANAKVSQVDFIVHGERIGA